MSRFFMLFWGMSIFCGVLYGQVSYDLTGSVVDESDAPLAGAVVILYPTNKVGVSDENGRFMMASLSEGHYQIQISFLGFELFRDSVEIVKSTTYKARLRLASQKLQEVLVTDNYAEIRKSEVPLQVDVVNEGYLKQNMGGSLMNSLVRLPGVTTIGIGSGQSKPVIRGLGFNRVVVVDNNIKHEAQQWGADHGLEIDQYAVEHIEVIKGPASLMYGSDAVGGVIDMNNRKLPRINTWGGSVDLSAKINNGFLGTSVSLSGRKERFYAGMRATVLDFADFKVPADSIDIYSYRAALDRKQLRNTAGYEKNLHANMGFIASRFQSRFYVSRVDSKTGFFANAHGLEPRNVDVGLHDKSNRDIQYPYQTDNHFKAINTSRYRSNEISVEMDLGFQRNFRQEWSQYVNHGFMPAIFPDTLDFNPDLEREFEKYVYSGNLKFLYQPTEKAELSFGLNNEYQDNRIGGRGFIIPEYRQFSWGAYAIVRYDFSQESKILSGVRYDYGRIRTFAYSDWFSSPVNGVDGEESAFLQRSDEVRRSFSTVTWSVGYNYNPGNWSGKLNAGKSFRMPIAKELGANGVNYHYFRSEVGDAQLSPEQSCQLDAGLEYRFSHLSIGLAPFLNYFSNYIYLNPTSQYDRLYGNGNQVFYYTQSKVFRYGGEAYVNYTPLRYLHFEVIGEYVYSEQLSGEKKGFSLPFSPPPSVIFNVRYEGQKVAFVERPYWSIDYRLTAPQNNVVPPEDPTNGYQLVNMGIGGDFPFGKAPLTVSFQVQNVFNTKYFSHTSYYRLINVPEAGRNFILNISIPFSGTWQDKEVK